MSMLSECVSKSLTRINTLNNEGIEFLDVLISSALTFNFYNNFIIISYRNFIWWTCISVVVVKPLKIAFPTLILQTTLQTGSHRPLIYVRSTHTGTMGIPLPNSVWEPICWTHSTCPTEGLYPGRRKTNGKRSTIKDFPVKAQRTPTPDTTFPASIFPSPMALTDKMQ